MSIPRGAPPSSTGSDPVTHLRQALITGVALTIPLVITLFVVQFALNLVGSIVAPFVAGYELVFGNVRAPDAVVETVTVLTLGAVVLLIGLVAEYRAGRGRFTEGFDALMARIPGVGSVYTGIRRMSDVLLEQDIQSFREVVLVEFPREGSHMLGFVTAEPPQTVHDAAGVDELRTLFVPLAPNPVMGGFLVNLPAERVHAVDLTVEEGVQAIVTSGTAIDPRVEDVDTGGRLRPGGGEFLDGVGLDSDVLGGGVLSGADEAREER